MPVYMEWSVSRCHQSRTLQRRYAISFLYVYSDTSAFNLQVRFSISSSPVFSRTDLATDSERFYNSILDLLEDPDEQEEVGDLTAWWNRSVNNTFV